ncbi:MAG: SPOR domain-containing protein [Limnochordales bacterium]|nr:SPOR domain-containing protein [Limnochordales bacterium]
MRGGRHRPGRGSGLPAGRPAHDGGQALPPGGLKVAARKKRPYRSQLTVLYIIAVIACVILGYIVGQRLLPGNEEKEQLAQSTLAGAGSGQVAGENATSSSMGTEATGQDSESLLPPLITSGASSDVVGAGVDDTAGAAGDVRPSTSPQGSEVPQVSLPVLGAGGVDTSVAPRPAAPFSAETSGSSTARVSSPAKSGKKSGEQAVSSSAPTGAAARQTSPAPVGGATEEGLYRVIVGKRASLSEAKALEARAKEAGLEVWVSGSGPYQVQVGAFRNRANAVAYAEELQSRGFPEAEVIEPAS